MLHEKIKEEVITWRENNYECNYPEINEIFSYIRQRGYLRKAQIEALEHYWYLRVCLDTPRIENLYKRYYNGVELLKNLGIPHDSPEVIDIMLSRDTSGKSKGIEGIIEKIKEDDSFVQRYRLEGLRETLSLLYPSYILALAMGAGKTILIASIIAMEFALSFEYPDSNFVKNVLVFAPGKTILGALREISYAPYDDILPPRLLKRFTTNVKFTYTRDGEKDIPVIENSFYNVIVTNTEKIRLTKESIKKTYLSSLLTGTEKEEEAKSLIANMRLKKIASLPNLGVFSDEAHHTYGQKIGEELKRVRQTINYIAEKTSLIITVNTTGTPYYQNKVLRDVIYWYGLSRGIEDGILKDVRGNIVAYHNVSDENFVKEVVEDFIENYWDVSIYNGAKAKLAIYFPKIDDIYDVKSLVEKVLITRGVDPSLTVLEVHNKAPQQIQDLFDNRINDPDVPYRIFLLVNKGTEGWNCPSLFACALARELRGSNNFCLQAATRCLRQVPNNTYKAKIYLSEKNVALLDSQLRETYGESLSDINNQQRKIYDVRLVVKKVEIPPIIIKKKVIKVIANPNRTKTLLLPLNELQNEKTKVKKSIYNLSSSDKEKKILVRVKEQEVETEEPLTDVYSLAADIADNYRLNYMETLKLLKKFFANSVIPESLAYKIKEILEKQISQYEVKEEVVEHALALVKPEGFKYDDKQGYLYTEIKISEKYKELLLYSSDIKKNSFGFHYDPYNFDSKPEREFFMGILSMLNEDPDNIEDIYFTGAISSKDKTDFIFEYKGTDGKWHNYTPDFLIRKKDGKMIIVEIKGEPFRNEEVKKTMQEIEGLNPNEVKYEILETEADFLKFGEIEKIRKLIYEKE